MFLIIANDLVGCFKDMNNKNIVKEETRMLINSIKCLDGDYN